MSETTAIRGSRKAIRLPHEGDFLTDGKRLVEVVGNCREGYQVLDVTAVLDEDGDPEVLNPDVAIRAWRVVEPAPEESE